MFLEQPAANRSAVISENARQTLRPPQIDGNTLVWNEIAARADVSSHSFTLIAREAIDSSAADPTITFGGAPKDANHEAVTVRLL
jgi:hypothetical protein